MNGRKLGLAATLGNSNVEKGIGLHKKDSVQRLGIRRGPSPAVAIEYADDNCLK